MTQLGHMPPCERLISWSAARRKSGRKTLKTPIEVDPVANAVSVALGLRHEEQAFEVPARLFEQLPFAVYLCDRDGLVLRYNRRAAELWGRSPKIRDPNERFCGSYRMFRPDGSLLPHHECPVADVLRTGVSVREQEVHIERPDGLRGIVLIDIEVIKDSDGNIVGAVNCFQDITERKRGEEAALRLAAIIESSDDAIVSKDLDGTIRSWNGGAQRIFGYLAEEVIGKPIAILIPPDRHNEETAILERLRRGERISSYETVRRHKDGSPVNVSFTVSPLKNTEGRVIGASKIARNITQEKHAEVRLRESEARLQAAVDLVKLGRYAWNPQTNELQWDDTLRAMWGLAAGAPVDYEVWRAGVHPDDLARVEAAIQRCADPRSDGVFDIEYRAIGKTDGVERWIATRGRTTFENDAPVSFFGVALEITDRKRIERRLERRVEERTRELEETNQQLGSQIEKREIAEAEVQQLQRLDAIGQITSGVAHDFNNLLSVVLTNARLLSRTVQRPDEQEGIELIRTAADRGAKLIAKLLAFSRKQQLEPYDVDLNSKIAGMGDLLGATLGGTVRLKTIFAPDLWPASVDPNQIEMIVLNIAINARDAMQPGGTLTIETFNTVIESESFRPEEPSPGDYVVLAVKDTGTGIPDDVLLHVFEPFFTTKEPGKGSGLGLAQVFGFAKQSGGGVRIETRLGQGTAVKVFLPRAGVDVADHHAHSVDASKRLQTTKGLRVLIVDDDKAVLRSTVRMLDVLGYAAVSAESGSEALRLLASNQEIDLVLADFAMPEMSGGELAKAICAMRPTLPVILMTGYSGLAVLKELNDLRIILKPFTEDDVVNAIGAALGRASDVR
jgi:PAS domain S-box-containing protein